MYCPRCKVETGTDTFCENCGGATVASSEIAATTVAQEEIKGDQIKIDGSKLSLKKIVGIAISVIIAVGIVTGYKALQAQYTPRSAVEKFYSCIVKEDYDKAFKMLLDTDDRFMTKENFKAAMKQKNIKQYYIKNYKPNEFQQKFDMNNLQNTNMKNLGNMFTIQTNNELYPIAVVKSGSKLVFFKDYKINTESLSTKWEIVSPQGAKITINGKEPELSTEPNYDGKLNLNDKYKPATVMYQVDRIFQGSYDVTAKMDGAEDVVMNSAQAGKKVIIRFNASADTVKKLQDKAKNFLDLYYSKASEDKFTSILTTDSNALSRITEVFGSGWGSDKVTNKLQNLKVTKSQLDDANHATITLEALVNYEDSSMIEFGGTKQTGTKDVTTDFYFKRVDGNWLICDTGYIN